MALAYTKCPADAAVAEAKRPRGWQRRAFMEGRDANAVLGVAQAEEGRAASLAERSSSARNDVFGLVQRTIGTLAREKASRTTECTHAPL